MKHLLQLVWILAALAWTSVEARRVWRKRRVMTPTFINPNRFPVTGFRADSDRSEEVNPQIINGEVVTPGSHPYTCSLQLFISGQWFFICGSVIFNKNTIMTAAHCVENVFPGDLRVRCGEFDLIETDPFEVTKGITEIRVHPEWKLDPTMGFPNDIATLKVDSPLVFNDFVNTLPIPKPGTQLARNCQLVGWGVTETGQVSLQLREVTIRRLSNRRCRRTWGDLISQSQVCFQDRGEPDAACNGDSGGPAVCGKFLAGITSWGRSGCSSAPSVYTRLSSYRDWIIANSF